MDAHWRRQNRQEVIAVALAVLLAVGMCGGLAVAPRRVAAAMVSPAPGGGCSTASFMQVAGSPFGAGTKPESVAVGDFNGDGKPDLAVANSSDNNVTILLGDGKGGFSQPAASPVGVGNGPDSVAVGDFNGDGKLDLAVANLFSDNVTILLGDGKGGFSKPAGSPVGAGFEPFSVAVGDFNGDGKPDLAVTSTVGGVTILLGDGKGGFPTGATVGAGNSPVSVAVGDFNGDGKLDLAVANDISGNVTILLGDGKGGFPTGATVGAGNSPVSMAVGDFNGDGKPDLAVANSGDNNVTVQLNTCSSPSIITQSVTRTPDGSSSNSQIASVDDNDDPKNTLTVTVNSGSAATANGVTVSGISVDSSGSVTANVSAACGATTASFTLRVTNSDGFFAEATLTVTVNAPSPLLLTNSPSGQTACSGSPVSFTAAATGSTSVQWQVSTNGGSSFANIDGATSTTLTINSVTASQNGNQYRAVFSNACTSMTTSAGTLMVNAAPMVTVNPTDQTAVAGGPVAFTAAASGSPSPSVQWQVSTNGGATFANINGATNTTLSFTPTPSQSGNRYRAVFMNICGGNVTTSAAILTVYDVCLKDGSTGNLFQFNSVTGEYKFTRCSDGFMLTGTGVVTTVNSVLTVTDFKPDRRVNAGFILGQKTGSATINLQVAPGVWQTFRINSTNPSVVCACTG